MLTLASRRLLEFPLPADASIWTHGEAVVLCVRRATLVVTVTVPMNVREWFAEAADLAGGAPVKDCCDYDGYDATPPEALDHGMADDVARFVARLLYRELRQTKRSGPAELQWKVGDEWLLALPFGAESF